MPFSREDRSLSEQHSVYYPINFMSSLPFQNPNSNGSFIHDWGFCVQQYFINANYLNRSENLYRLLMQLFDFLNSNRLASSPKPIPSADIRQVAYWMGKLSEEAHLFLPAQVVDIKSKMQRVSQLLLSIGGATNLAEKFIQEMSNTLYGLGQLVHTGWLFDSNDDFKDGLIQLFTVFSEHIQQSQSNPFVMKFHTQNISAVFYALYLMRNASVLPPNANYDFIPILMNVFESCSRSHPGDRMSQDICFLIQGITSMVEQRLLPKSTDLTMLFNKLPAILFNMPPQTIKLVDHIKRTIVCLVVLTEFHTISRADFATLLALMTYCLRIMRRELFYTANGRLEILNSAINLCAKAELQEDEQARLDFLSTNVNELNQEAFVRRLDQVLRPTQPPSTLHQSARFFSEPLMVTLPQASQREFTTLRNWLRSVELESNLLQPLQRSSSAFIKSTTVNTLLEQAFTFLMQNVENWESQQNPLEKARILIYGLGLLAQYADRIHYQKTSRKYQCGHELSCLFNVVSDSIMSCPLEPSSINVFIENVQFAFFGLKFILSSRLLFSEDLHMIDFSSLNLAPSVNKLVTCLEETRHRPARSQLCCVLSTIQSLGAMVESSALHIGDGHGFTNRLINLLFRFSESVEVPLIDLKGVVNAFRFLFRLNSLQDPAVSRGIILNTLLIPFKRASNQQAMYKCVVLTKFYPEIAVGLSLIDQNDDVQAIQVICNLMGLMNTSSVINIPQSLIDSAYQQIHQLLIKQLNVGYQPNYLFASSATMEAELGTQANEPRYNLDEHVLSCNSQYHGEGVYPSVPLVEQERESSFSDELCFNYKEPEENMNERSKTGSSYELEPDDDNEVPFSKKTPQPWF